MDDEPDFKILQVVFFSFIKKGLHDPATLQAVVRVMQM
jgi:hypothetical protein